MTEAAASDATRELPVAVTPSAGVVAAIGAFDGLHRGHQVLLREMVQRAEVLGARTVYVTFDPDPGAGAPSHGSSRDLYSADRARQLIAAVGVDEVFVVFTPAVAQISPRRICGCRLSGRYPLVEVWVGADFGFGRNRAGNVQALPGLGKRHGFAVHARRRYIDRRSADQQHAHP